MLVIAHIVKEYWYVFLVIALIAGLVSRREWKAREARTLREGVAGYHKWVASGREVDIWSEDDFLRDVERYGASMRQSPHALISDIVLILSLMLLAASAMMNYVSRFG